MCRELPGELIFNFECGYQLLLIWPRPVIDNATEEDIIKWELLFIKDNLPKECNKCTNHYISEYELYALKKAIKNAIKFHKENKPLLYRLKIWS